MTNENTLDILIDQAQSRLEETGRLLALLIQQHREAQQQLETLADYRQEYSKRLQRSGENGVLASNYHNFRQFIATLDDAISQQNKVVAQIDSRLQSSRTQWTQQKHRLGSFETLKTRQQHKKQYQEQRREQRASDELAAGIYRRMRQET